MASNPNLRPSERPANAGRVVVLRRPSRLLAAAALLLAAGAATALSELATLQGHHAVHATPTFLNASLGRARPHAPLVRTPAPHVTATIAPHEFAVTAAGHRISLAGTWKAGTWKAHQHGARRSTRFGHETIVVTQDAVEQFLTVDRRVGARTWRWHFGDSHLTPRVGDDGAVAFIDNHVLLTSTTIAPVRILDADGSDVTPKGLRWSVDGNDLLLTLDDSKLPEPYVIDPAITIRTGTTSTTAGGNGTSVTLSVPAGARVGDVLVAQIVARGAATITKPAAMTLVGAAPTQNTNVTQGLYYRWIQNGDAASYQWTLGASNLQYAGALTVLAGVKGTAPLGATGTAKSTTATSVSDNAIASAPASSLVISNFALAAGAATLNYTTPAGTTFMYQAQSASQSNTGVSLSADYVTQGATGATTARSATCTNCTGVTSTRGIGQQVAWAIDAAAPTVSITQPANTLRGTVTISGQSQEADSSNDVTVEYQKEGTSTWTQIGSAQQSTAFTNATYNFTVNTATQLAGDGFYLFRIVAKNGAWSTSGDEATAVAAKSVRVDNSSPDQNTLGVNEVTGTQYQYFDSSTNTQWYNPSTAGGSFTVSSAPRDVTSSIQFVGQSSGGDGTGGPLTINVPAGTQNGDVMIMHLSYETGTSATYTTPAGWTQIARLDQGTTWGQVAYYRVASSEPASYTFTLTSSALANISGGITVWRNVSTAVPIDSFATGAATTGTLSITAPTVTPNVQCDRLLALNGIWTQGPVITPAGSMTNRYSVSSNETAWDTGSEFADEILGPASATGTRVATATATGANSTGDRTNNAFSVLLRPKVCVSSVTFPTVSTTGWTTGAPVTDQVEPYLSPAYTWTTAATTEPGATTVSAQDEAGNGALNTTFTIKKDTTAPAFASAPTAGGSYNTLSVPVATTTATDTGGSGVDATTYSVERDTGTASNGSCTWNNTWSTVTLVGGNDTTVTAPGCYRYRMRVSDNVSNSGVSAASADVIVDQTNPSSAGTVSISESNASTYANGSTLYYRPAGAGGNFDVTVSSPTDAHSGIGKVRFPGLTSGFTPATSTDDSSAPYTNTYSVANGASDSGSKTITVFDAAGNSVTTSFSLTADSSAPSSTVTTSLAGQSFRAATYPTTWSGTATDGAGSGLQAVQISLKDPNGNYWNGSTFSGASETFNNATGTTAWSWSAPSLSTDGTYTVHVQAVDNVGNVESSSTFSFVYDTTAPTVSSASSTKANGAYPAATSIPVTVTFGENVTVTGSPQLALNSGGTATYSSGSGTSTLTFAYTTGATDNSADLDYSATTSLTLNGGTIKDAAGNNATLTLPAVGGASSIGGQKNIVVDTTSPTASVTTPASNGLVYNGSSLPASLGGSSNDTGGSATVSAVAVAIQDGGGNYWNGATFGSASIVYNATGGTVGAWTYSTATLVGQLTDGHTYTITARSTDAAGNTGTATRTFVYDTTAPTVSSVTSSTANGAYKQGQSVSIQVSFSETVNVTGTPTLALNSGGSASYSSGTGTSTLTFAYTVGAGENAADLDYAATTSLALAGGTIKDAATNNATLTLPTVGGASSLGGQKNIQIDTTNPTAAVTTPAADGTRYNAASLPANLAGTAADTGGSSTVSSTAVAVQDGAGNYWNGTSFGSASIVYNAATGTTAWTYATPGAGTLVDGHTYTVTIRATDAAGNTGTSTRTFVYDTTAPTVTSVSASTADGAYKAGQSVTITVSFSEAVNVTGSPLLALNSGGTASYSGGSGGSTLSFAYTIGAGENAADLDYAATSSLTLNGGTIRDAATNNATLTLPTVGGASSLGGQKNIQIDTTNPTAAVTTPAADGTRYNAASLPANLAGTAADTGGSSTVAATAVAVQDGAGNYWNGTSFGSASLLYNAATGTTAWTYATPTAANLTNGHTYTVTVRATDGAGNTGTSTRTFVYDTTAPTVTSVSASTADGAYKAGQSVTITVALSENVTVTGSPQLALNSGGTASYSGGSGGSTLSFAYTIGAGENAADLDYAATTSLTLNGGTIKDAATNNATLTLPTVGGASSLGGQKNIQIDTTNPTAAVTTPAADGTRYNAASLPANLAGTAADTGGSSTVSSTAVAVQDGTGNYWNGTSFGSASIVYSAATGTTAWTYATPTAANLTNGHTYTVTVRATDAAGNTGTSTRTFVYDTTAPTVTSVSASTADGAYKAGQSVTITVAFSENVTVTGTPTLALANGATATYSSGSGSSTLSFTYTIGAGEDTADLDYGATTSLSLNGGTIKDAASNAATLTLPAPGGAGSLGANKNIQVDTTAPTETVTTPSANGKRYNGTTLPASLAGGSADTGGSGVATVQVAIQDGGGNYWNGTSFGSAAIAYQPTTGSWQYSTAALGGALADGHTYTITAKATDNAGNTSTTTRTFVYDTTPATVTDVSSTNANGAYTTGQTVHVQVTFGEPVFVTGTPSLALGTTPARSATYASGDGTATLTFDYTVQAGDAAADLDYAASTSLTGSVKDEAGNAATLTLPTPGSAGSLGANKNIQVDTTAPTVSAVSATNADGSYKAGQTITVQVTFSKPVTVAGGTPTLALNTAPARSATYSSGSGGTTLSFAYTIQPGDSAARLDAAAANALALNGATIRDAAANDAATSVPTGSGTSGALANAKNLVVDTTAPTVANVTSSPATWSYRAGQTVPISVSFSEPVSVSGTPTLALSGGATATYASGSGGSTLTFDYVVGAGDNASPLAYTGTSALALAGGAIVDAAGNPAVLTLAAPGSAGSLDANTTITIDTLAPTVTGVTSTTPNGAYKQGDAVDVRISFSEPVAVTGTPTLGLSSGGTATYTSGSGTATLVFAYTVGAGETAARLDAAAANALAGTIADAAGNAADRTVATGSGTVGALANAKNIRIDTTAPTGSITTPATNGTTYNSSSLPAAIAGTTADGGAGVSAVDVAIQDGSGNYWNGSAFGSASIDYRPATGTTSWTFSTATLVGALADGHTYTVTARATDGAGNTSTSTRTFVFDVTAPAVTGISATNSPGAYRAGDVVHVTVAFSKAVTVSGTPRLTLNTTPSRTADYTSGSGTATLQFDYTIQAGDTAATLDATALAANGGTIRDSASNDANLAVPSPGAAGSLSASKAIVVDTTAPTVVSVSSTTPDGAYTAGTTVHVTVTFSESIAVTGTPQLALNTSPARNATFVSASGSTATFDYAIQPGDSAARLDYAATSSLSGGTIRDAAGNNANLTLSAPGGASSLGGQKSIVVDTSPPAATSRTVSGSQLDVSYSEPVAGALATTDFAVNVNGSADTVDAVSVVGGTTVRLTLRNAVRHLDAVTVDYTGTSLADAAGNAAATYSGAAATNLTPNSAPDPATQTTPADGVYVGSTTPTLSAAFADGDSQDFGKVVFQICADSGCATPLGTVDSTVTTLAVGQSGSAQIPVALNLQTATQYWWRAKSVDSSSASSAYSAARSFTVDTTKPTIDAAAAPGDAAEYYDAVGRTLWVNASAAGTFTITATAADAQSGIAGVDFPALFSTSGAADPTAPYSRTYAFDGTGTPVSSPGATTITARNGVTVPGPSTQTDSITVEADAAPPAAFDLTSPANGTAVADGATLSAPVTDTGSGVASVTYYYCDVTVSGPCSPSTPIGTATIAATNYALAWSNSGLTDGHTYAVSAVATDNVGHTRTATTTRTVVVDNSPPTVSVTAPSELTGQQYQSFDAATKTIWLNPAQSGSFALTAGAADPHSGIASVAFPALLGTSANTDVSAPYQSSVYTFNAPTAQGSRSIAATNGVVDPAGATTTDSFTVDVDGTSPTGSTTFPLDTGSYDSGSWSSGCATAGLCGNANDAKSGVAKVEISLEDRTTGTWFGGASFDQGSQTYLAAAIAGTSWSYALPDTKLISPHAYAFQVRVTDNVGNVLVDAVKRFTFGTDVGAPTTAVSLTGATHASLAPTGAGAYNLYYSTANGAGGFTVHVDATDPSGVDTVSFPNLGSTAGFSGGARTATNSANADPFAADSNAYSFTTSASTPAPAGVTSTDIRGNSGTDTLTFFLDNTAPTGGSLTAPAGYVTTASFPLSHVDFTADAGSGVASSTLTVASASLANNACGTFGSDVPAADGTFAASDATCYRFTLTGVDKVGNATTIVKTVKVDETAPSAPALAFSGGSSNTHDDGAGRIYYRPSAGGTFSVDATATDAESGIGSYTFDPLTGFGGSSSQSGGSLTVTFNGGTSGSGTFGAHATNRAGLDSATSTYAITEDSTAPAGGSLTVNGSAASAGAGSSSYLTSGSAVAFSTTPYSDAGSGLASQVLTVETAPLAADACGTYGAPAPVSGSSYSVASGNCYRFTLTAKDNVGNVTAVTTTVKVDTTAPTTPSVSFSNLSSGNTYVSGSTLFYRPSAGGTFTVAAGGAADPETGIKSGNAGYSFTPLTGFASASQAGNKVDVTFDGSSAGGGAQSVSAISNAGVASLPAAFTVTRDAASPTGGALSTGAYSSSLTVNLAKTDFADAGSGIASNAITRSDPLAPVAGSCPAGGYTGSTPVAGATDVVPQDGRCYEYTLTGTDNVGNVSTATARVLVDSTAPAGGSVSYVDGVTSLTTINVDVIGGGDAESGISSVQVERATASFDGTSCQPLGAFAPISLASGTDSVVAGNCYAYRVVSTNGAGVSATFTSPSVVKVVNASPIDAVGANTFVNGSTLWLGQAPGSFTLKLRASGANGVTSVDWPAAAGTLAGTGGNVAAGPDFTSPVYTWSGAVSTTLAVTRNPNAAADSLTVSTDTAAPTGSITYPNATILAYSVPVSTSQADAGSGVAGVVVERASAPLTGTTCGTWSAFAPVVLAAGNDTTVTDSTCYQYRAVVTDHVGNSATFTSANVVQIPDITAPTLSAAATNAAGTLLTLTFSEPLDTSTTTPASAFAITYDGVPQTATSIAISGATVTLGLPTPPNDGETVKVGYAQPGSAGDRIRDNASPTKNETASFGAFSATNNTPDTTPPSVTSASVDSSTLTIGFSEPLSGTAPDASAFDVMVGSVKRSVTAVSISGATVTLTLSPAVANGDAVSVAYAVPASNGLHDAAANAVAPFTRTVANQTPFVAPPAASTDVTAGPALVSASPEDGSTVREASTITLVANQGVTWSRMTVTRPDGTTFDAPNESGRTAVWQLPNVAPGLYVVRGAISANGRSADVLTHFTVWTPPALGSDGDAPPVQKNAVPFLGGELWSSDGRTQLVWPAGAFADDVVVEVAPTKSQDVKNVPPGGVVVDVRAFLRSTRATVRDLRGVADVRFANAAPGGRAVTSPDGSAWSEIPQLATLSLPDGQPAGWFRDSDGTVHVLTRHLAYYALVGQQVSTKLAMRIITVRRLWLENRSFIAVRLALTGPARVTGSFVAPDGTVVPGQTIRTPTRHAGVTILRVPLSITRPGLYRLQMHADGLAQTVDRTAKIRFLATRPASPVWQQGAIRVAVVQGTRGLGRLDDALGRGFVVRTVADAELYDAVDTSYRTAAAAVVVDLATVPASTLASLHALLPEVKIVGIASKRTTAGVYSSLGVGAVLPRGSSAETVAKTIKSLLR